MEREILRWLRDAFPARPPVEVGIGDDAAVLRIGSERLVLTTDAIVDRVHFDLRVHSWQQVGWKAIAVNLSDLAAMAAEPLAVAVALVLPKSTAIGQVQSLYAGIRQITDQYGVALIGGDTNLSDGPLVVCPTALGRVDPQRPAWRVTGARPGDAILVSGDLGGSILGKHLAFEPRCGLANYLSAGYAIRAATDISDGLVIDLARICEASGCGAQLRLGDLPISLAARGDSPSAAAAVERALYDGEDFELLIACDSAEAERILRDPRLPTPMTRIGVFTSEKSIAGRGDDGESRPLPIRGYEHRGDE